MQHLTFVLVTLLLAGEAVAAPRPEWADNPPPTDAQFVYVVGEGGPANTMAEAQKAAFKDALVKLASQIEITITGRTISTLSTKASDTFSEYRESVRAKVTGAEPVGAPFITVEKKGVLLFRRRRYSAKVLVRLARVEIEQERARHQSVRLGYQEAVRDLADQVVRKVKNAKKTLALGVGGWRETTTGRRYTLSTVLEQDLVDTLGRQGIAVVPLEQAKIVLTGSYRVQGQEILATARLKRLDGSRQVPVGDAVFDVDAIEPQWLELSQPVEPALEALEPERAETKTRVGAIAIDSKPPGARLYLDGADVGRTPVDLRGVEAGERAVTLLLDRYEPFTAKLRVVEGEKAPLEAVLSLKTGNLDVRSTPEGADVAVDSQRRGRTPLKVSDLPIGTHEIALSLRDFRSATVEVEVKHKETAKIEVSLTELPGSLFVISDPSGATISLDGVEVGKARAPDFLKVDDVRAGEREIEALLPGVGSWRGSVQVRAGQTAQVMAKIENQLGSLMVSLSPPEARLNVGGREWRDAFARSGNDAAGTRTSLPPETPSDRIFEKAFEIGTLPRTMTIPLPEGKHEIEAWEIGYKTERRTVSVGAGRVKRIDINLEPQVTKMPAGGSSEQDSGTGTKVAAGAAIILIPGSPFLAWNGEGALSQGNGLIWFAVTIVTEGAMLAHKNWGAAGAIHGGAFLIGVMGGVAGEKKGGTAATTDKQMQLTWSRRF